MSNLPFTPPSDGVKPRGVTHDPAADMLLAEILPGSQPNESESLQRALPGPQTIGQGLIPGSGTGAGAVRAVGPVGEQAAESDQVPNSSARAIMPIRSPTSSTALAAWAGLGRSKT